MYGSTFLLSLIRGSSMLKASSACPLVMLVFNPLKWGIKKALLNRLRAAAKVFPAPSPASIVIFGCGL